jgi:hypothetical protein
MTELEAVSRGMQGNKVSLLVQADELKLKDTVNSLRQSRDAELEALRIRRNKDGQSSNFCKLVRSWKPPSLVFFESLTCLNAFRASSRRWNTHNSRQTNI